MKPLTLDKAVLLYEILGEHIPEFSDDDPLEFVGKIVDNIVQSNQHKDYVDAVMLMSGSDWEEIKQMDSENVLELFIKGLMENKIVRLKDFFEQVGYNYARS
jgi:hypothetical protein